MIKTIDKRRLLHTKILPLLAVGLFIFVAGINTGCSVLNLQPTGASESSNSFSIIANNLEIPWALDFLPDDSILFTERPGRIRLINSNGNLMASPVLEIAEVASRGEGGLLGLTLHPDFAENGFVYVYYTYQESNGLANKVVRYVMRDNSLHEPETIIEGIPGASIHDGGRIDFGPDGLLYIATGDASRSELAQDTQSLAGKILRLDADGSIPPDNPFGASPVYSYGHRNPQGLAWDSEYVLWATEHGSSATDEVNRIIPGENYGWPLIRGDQISDDMMQPYVHSGGTTWAPSGAAVYDSFLVFAGLRSRSLWRLPLGIADSQPEPFLINEFGRLRGVTANNGSLYIWTSNRDGRGIPVATDDRIIRIPHNILD